MPETENGTSPDLLECIQNIPNSISVARLREVTQENLDFLMSRYPQSEFPLLYRDLQDLMNFLSQFDSIESTEGKIFWILHVYLCFFSNFKNPLGPRDRGRKKIIGYLIELKNQLSKLPAQ